MPVEALEVIKTANEVSKNMLGNRLVMSSFQEVHTMKTNIVSLFVGEVRNVMGKMVASMHSENFGDVSHV